MKANFSWMRKRQTKYGAYLVTYTLIVLALIVAANWAVDRYNKKTWDLTANKQFSLSDQTRKIVSGLQNEVKIYYFDKQGQFDRARDLLGQYDRLSPKLSVDYVDPDRKPTVARDMAVKTYGSIILTSAEKRQEANVLDEESITTALIRVIKSGPKTICFVEGHGEHDPESSDRQGFSQAKKALEDSNYAVKNISLLREPNVPQDCSVVVVAGPKNEYVETEIQALRSFVEGGGSGLFLIDPGSSEKLGEMLAGWNVELKKNLLVDLNPVNQLFGADVTMPIVTSYKSHSITRELNRVATMMPFARTVEPGKESKSGVSVETLFETSEQSWATDFDAQTKQVEIRRDKDPKGPLPIAVAGTVKVEKAAGDGGAAATPVAAETPKQGRFAVYGSSRFPANNYVGFNGNKDLFVNTVNWLSADEDLISIRPKPPENRRINLSTAQMRRVLYLSVFGLPLLIVVSGVAVWWRRR